MENMGSGTVSIGTNTTSSPVPWVESPWKCVSTLSCVLVQNPQVIYSIITTLILRLQNQQVVRGLEILFRTKQME